MLYHVLVVIICSKGGGREGVGGEGDINSARALSPTKADTVLFLPVMLVGYGSI